MRRKDQFADLMRLDELAMKASGEIATAAVLAVRDPDYSTIENAANFAKANPQVIPELVGHDLQFGWISAAIFSIRKKTCGIDVKKVGTYDAASQSTKSIFENVVRDIRDDLRKTPSGVYPCIKDIFENDRSYNRYPAEALDRVKNIKLLADQIERIVWRITHPYWYYVTDRRLITALVLASVVAVPIWYFFGYHEQQVATLPDKALGLVQEDLAGLKNTVGAPDRGFLASAAAIASFAWHALLAGPSVFLVPAALLKFARRRQFLKSDSLRRYEKLFGDVGKELRKASPNTSRWLTVELMMSGFNVTIGHNNIVNATVIDSFNKIEGRYDAGTEAFLKAVGEEVTKSGDEQAAKHYKGVTDNLAQGEKGLARTMWDGLVKILPPVGAIAGAAGAIVKLFGP